MILSLFTLPVFSKEKNTITVYVSLSKHGEFVTEKTGNLAVALPVSLSNGSYTLDDVFTEFHELYYEGDSGYSSYEGDWGLAIDTLWGDDSGLFGYQVNRGTESVMGLSHTVDNGDFIDVYINESVYPDNEAYSCFDVSEATFIPGVPFEITLTGAAGYDENFNTIFAPVENAVITIDGIETDIITDSYGVAEITIDDTEKHIISAVKNKTVGDAQVTAITAPLCIATLPKFTVPKDAVLFVGQQTKYYLPFTEVEPYVIESDDSETTYYYNLYENTKYNYRISYENYVTYADVFSADKNCIKRFKEDSFSSGKTTIDRNLSSNGSYNVADIFLNINAKNYLKLNTSDTYQLIPQRSWQIVNNTVNNYYVEPDYHYSVIDEYGNTSDIVTINDEGVLTAVSSGTAIVLVTYDAINVPSVSGGGFFGAIWPENTGVFVVSVDAADSNINTGMTINENTDTAKLSGNEIDAELDVIYYIGDKGKYSFTPETEGLNVYVANPSVSSIMTFDGFEAVSENQDGSFDIPLTNGRNIVKLEKDGAFEYQVITAKPVEVTINNGVSVYPGDKLSIEFNTLYHPINKLAGIYNFDATAIYTQVTGYTDRLIGGLYSQYNFASDSSTQNVCNVLKLREDLMEWDPPRYEKDTDIKIPSDYSEDTYILSGGKFFITGYGDPYGNHRNITLTEGKPVNFNADIRTGYLGILPDIEITLSKKTDTPTYGGGGGGAIPPKDKDDEKKEEEDTEKTPETETEEKDKPVFTPDTFKDIKETDWYYDAVKYSYENSLMQGTDIGFEPDKTMTRAMLVTVLYRLEAPKSPGSEASFDDIKGDEWYAKAVKWAYANKLVSGTGDGKFNPNGNITREQLTLIMYNYAQFRGKDMTLTSDISAFSDRNEISNWANNAFIWAKGSGLINGVSQTELNPKGTATRGQVATILMRYIENIMKK